MMSVKFHGKEDGGSKGNLQPIPDPFVPYRSSNSPAHLKLGIDTTWN